MKGIKKEEQNYIEANRRFLKHKTPMSWRQSLKNRTLWALITSYFTNQFAFYFFVAWMPVYLQEGRSLSENDMKIVTAFVYISGILGALSSGWLNDWLAKKRSVRFARQCIGVVSLLLAACSILVASMTGNAGTIACLITANFAIVVNTVTSFSVCVDIGGERAGTVAGIMNFAGQTGAFFVAVSVGKIVQTTHNFNNPLILICSLLFAGCLCWIWIDSRRQFFREKIENS